MFCAKCGTACLPEHKFCKNCGAALGAAGSQLEVAPAAAIANLQVPGAQGVQAAAPALYQNTASVIPPGGPQAIYQGAPPQFYYVSPLAAAQAQTVHQKNLLVSLRTRLQRLASTENLEGFSLKAMFSEAFKRHGAEAVEDYILVGTSKTTPPLVVAYVAITVLYMRTGNANCVPGMMFLGAFAVPLATLVLFFELNTPRNVSLHMVGKLFLMGAIASLAVALLGYSLPIFNISDMEAGVVEEVAKLLTVVVVMRSVRYKYILNGILFGATVGAGFAAFESAGYALNEGFLAGMLTGITHGQTLKVATHGGVVEMLRVLRLRGILAPLGHVAWTALAAGAFWRVKQGKPTNVTMLFDTRFLKAFMIPVVLHAIWDAPLQMPFLGSQISTGIITWYVVFGIVQQGLRQVKEEQKSHLQSTLENVEAQMQAPAAVVV